MVCLKWRTIIVANASFWSKIDADDRPKFRQLALERSKEHALAIRCDEASRDAMDFLTADTFLDFVKPTMDRWDTLTLHVDRDESYIHDVLKTPAPHLRIASLMISMSAAGTLPEITLFEGQAPKLEVLSSNHPIRWEDAAWPRLQDLSLSFSHAPPQSLERIRTALANFPVLEKLDFMGLAVITPFTSIANQTRLTLPRLKTLHMTYSSPIAIGSIVQMVEAPACSDLRLSPPYGSDHTWFDESITTPLTSIADSIKPLLVQGGVVTIHLNLISLERQPNGFHLGWPEFNPSSPNPFALFEWYMDTFDTELKSTPIKLTLGKAFRFEDEGWARILTKLGSKGYRVDRLELYDGVIGVDRLLEYLSTAVADSETETTTTSSPFSHLRELDIHTFVQIGTIKNFVKTRYLPQFQAKAHPSSPPHILDKLTFRRSSAESSEWMQDVLRNHPVALSLRKLSKSATLEAASGGAGLLGDEAGVGE